jgi:hypothetical protein
MVTPPGFGDAVTLPQVFVATTPFALRYFTTEEQRITFV